MHLLFICFAVVSAEYYRFPDDQVTVRMNGYTDRLADWGEANFRQSGRDWPGLCSTGEGQSPIDITHYPADPRQYRVVTSANSTFGPIRFRNSPAPVSLQFNGLFDTNWLYTGTMQLDVNGMIQEEVLALLLFEAPAEHTINGVRYPMGINLMYASANPDGSISFGYQVYVLIREGRRNEGLEQYLAQVPLDVSYFLPSRLDDYYFYMGSLNAWENCQEHVPWIVSNSIVEAAPDQIAVFTDQFVNDLRFSNGKGNARAIQPLNGRTIYHYVSMQ